LRVLFWRVKQVGRQVSKGHWCALKTKTISWVLWLPGVHWARNFLINHRSCKLVRISTMFSEYRIYSIFDTHCYIFIAPELRQFIKFILWDLICCNSICFATRFEVHKALTIFMLKANNKTAIQKSLLKHFIIEFFIKNIFHRKRLRE
jgi:hypothetical protein